MLDEAVDRLAVAAAKWDEEKPKVAADNVRKAIEFLNAADAADDELYTEYIEIFLARATKSAAMHTIWYATSIGTDQALIDSALALVAEGDALRAAGDYVGAALDYLDAIGELDDTLDQPSGDIYAAGEAVVVAEKAGIEALAADPATASKAVGPLAQAAGLLGDTLVAIAADDPGGAIGFIRGALGKLERAEAKDGNLDLTSVKDSLAGAGASLAGDAVAFATSNAVAAADFQAIDTALEFIAGGDAVTVEAVE
jgi:hypothetical protein